MLAYNIQKCIHLNYLIFEKFHQLIQSNIFFVWSDFMQIQ